VSEYWIDDESDMLIAVELSARRRRARAVVGVAAWMTRNARALPH